MRRSLDDLARCVKRCLVRGDLDTPLRLIARTMRDANRIAMQYSHIGIGSACLDALCQSVGASARERQKADQQTGGERTASPRPEDLYIASRIARFGGHTAVIGDFRAAQRGTAARLVVTDNGRAGNKLDAVALERTGFEARDVLILGGTSKAARLHELIELLETGDFRRIYLFNHPADSVAIAAVQPGLAEMVIFVHHSDRAPSLGSQLSGVLHADLTPYTFHSCCANGIDADRQIYTPLVAPDLGKRPRPRSDSPSHVQVTATSGRQDKFLHHAGAQQPIDYFETIAHMMAKSDVRHVHIGHLDQQKLDGFRAGLVRHGVDADRLIHVPHTTSVWRSMATFEVDLYLSSFPEPGARASVEVMGSGTPIVWHVPSDALYYHSSHMKYPLAQTWSEPAQLARILLDADGDWLQEQRIASRRHYEEFHTLDALRTTLLRVGGTGLGAPPNSKGCIAEPWRLEALLALTPLPQRCMRQLAVKLAGLW